MSKKLLLALAGCLPIALSGCGGGGGGGASSSPAAQSPSVESETQTPTAALDAAKTAVDNANSARTEAAVQRAIRALSAAVETAETAKTAAQADLDAAQAALTEAQDYRTAQTAILDGLQPITAARLSLAAVKPAATVAEAAAALDAARNAVAAATSTRTAAAIQRARRALSQAVDTADAAFDAARSDLFAASDALTRAQNYRTEQTPILNSLPFTQPPGTPPPPSSPPGEFNVTHVELSTGYSTWSSGGRPFQYAPRGSTSAPFGESYWRNVRNDASGLKNGFRRFADVNGITMAEKNFNQPISYGICDGPGPLQRGPCDLYGVLHFNNHIVGIGSYSAFDVVRLFHRCTTRPQFCGSIGRDRYDNGFRSVRRTLGWRSEPGRKLSHLNNSAVSRRDGGGQAR